MYSYSVPADQSLYVKIQGMLQGQMDGGDAQQRGWEDDAIWGVPERRAAFTAWGDAAATAAPATPPRTPPACCTRPHTHLYSGSSASSGALPPL